MVACEYTLLGHCVSLHVFVKRGGVDERFLALGTLELLHSSMCGNVSR